MTQIGGDSGQDPILFLQSLLEGYIKDDHGNDIRITYANPKQINQIPRVVLVAGDERMEFLSIPAVRRRWTAPFTLKIWAINVPQRYAIKQSLEARLDYLSNPTLQLAENYVYIWYKTHTYPDDTKSFGQPVFKIDFNIDLKYDVLISDAIV
jgi:hypothetical protein